MNEKDEKKKKENDKKKEIIKNLKNIHSKNRNCTIFLPKRPDMHSKS